MRRALREFQAGNWDEARVLFHQAHASFPNARTLRGIGMASYELRDYVEAYLVLGEALESEVRPLTRRQRQATVELRRQAGSFLGYLFIETTPPDADVMVDLEPVMPDREGNVYVNVGEHSVQVEAEGFVPQTQRFTVDGGEGKRIRITLEAIPPPPPAPVVEEPFPWPVVLLTSAGAFLAAAAVGVGWYVNRVGEVQTCEVAQNDPMFSCENREALAGQRDAALGFTLVMAGVALAAGTTGLVLLLTSDDDEEPEAATLACAPGIFGVVCAGRF